MSLSLGEHGRVPIGFGGIWMYISDVDEPISGLLSLAALLAFETLLFSILSAVERNRCFGVVEYRFAVIAGSGSMLEV